MIVVLGLVQGLVPVLALVLRACYTLALASGHGGSMSGRSGCKSGVVMRSLIVVNSFKGDIYSPASIGGSWEKKFSSGCSSRTSAVSVVRCFLDTVKPSPERRCWDDRVIRPRVADTARLVCPRAGATPSFGLFFEPLGQPRFGLTYSARVVPSATSPKGGSAGTSSAWIDA
jgi:hypothetical protein